MLALVFHVLFTFRFRRQIRQLAKTTGEADFGLAILAQVLQLMESASFSTPLLQQIHARLQTEGMPPSQRIAQLHRLIGALNNALQNQFYAPIAFLLCLPVHIVHGIEVWRTRVGSHIPDWLEAVGQFEALSSLAGYAWEHPADPFPELVEAETVFEADQLGHPLLPATQCVRNGIALTRTTPLIIISGSNMSGKSTMLRSVGTNTVLALAGAPVCATRLRLSRLQIGSAMRIHDSLQDGKSFFYANVSRLKQIVALADGQPPLLYLFDEILQGTNSHDRRVGAEGIIRKLLETPSIGLITTHDLALTRIADSQDSNVGNMHFEDHLIDGKMTFDYRIRPGVVERSNALELMRMMGLDV
jgi:DNA mismatch repair ATPase MutS